MLNGLDLFSGIGGISIAFKDYVRPIAYCEIDTYCQAVLLSLMSSGKLCCAPIWDDIRSFSSAGLEGDIDIIYGGFPCQDISVAGKGKGLAGERSGLFFEIMRLAKEIQPKFLFLENVPAITTRGGLEVVRTIAEMGYDCRWCTISAASVGALHRRERWFLLAHTKHDGTPYYQERGSVGECASSGQKSRKSQEGIGKTKRTSGVSSDVADTSSARWKESDRRESCGYESQESQSTDNGEDDSKSLRQSSEQANTRTDSIESEKRTRREHSGQYWPFESREHWQKTVCEMDKCSDGIPYHVDRLRSLGNAVVPVQVKEAFEILMGIK